ncbi:outer membrane protein assembly factor BamB family protein [Rhodococcoides yunnanense]|uniref:outer membrane protein assembly factor BamB family protein n=1 Tax=Rhodococcoides yunnanense TaxID=278209 RepID=UPI001FE906A6|nr:PQQ-binding-like beta-propeller repeat protein [Rhodococcus yunnanensis]
MSVAVVGALVAGGLTAVDLLRSSDEDVPVAGQLANTYPTQPQQGWTLVAEDILPGGIFMWPDSLAASYGTAAFTDLGSTLMTTIGTGPGQQTEVVAVDAVTGAVKWATPVDGTISCATQAIDGTLPCVVRQRNTTESTARVQFFDLDTGEIEWEIDRPTASMVEVSDGSVFTVDGLQRGGYTFSRGNSRDLEAQWSTDELWDSECVGSGDSHIFEVVDGIVHFQSARDYVLSASDGRLLSGPDLGNFVALPGQGFAGSHCAIPQPSGGYTTIVADTRGNEKFRVEQDLPAEPWLVSESDNRPYIGSNGAYDIENGTQLWSVEGGQSFSLQKVIGDVVLGVETDTLSAYRLDNGEQLWSTDVGDYFSFAGSDGEKVMLVSESELVAVDLTDGSTSWSLTSDSSRWSWGTANVGLANITNDALTYYPPTGGPAGAPGRLSAANENDDGDNFVTKCGKAPTLTPVEYRTEAAGLVVKMEMKASCPGGDIVSTDAMRVSITDSGASVASAVFDFSDDPVYLPRTDRTNSNGSANLTNTIEREFLYELDSFWRLPNSLGSSSSLTDSTASGTQLVECDDEGTSDESLTSGAPSESRTNSPIKAVRSAAPTTADVETTSLDALRAQANADFPFVTGDLADRWVAQISSKRVGLDAADINGAPVHWTAEQILRQHLQLRLMYPEVRLLWSDEWRTFDLRGWWITVAGLTFADADAANGWCDSRQIAVDQCYAKIVSNSRGSSGTTKYRR